MGGAPKMSAYEESHFDAQFLPSGAPKEGSIVQMVVNTDNLKWRASSNFNHLTAGAGPTRNAIIIGTFLLGNDGGWYVKCIVHKNQYGDQHLYLPRFAPNVGMDGKYEALLLPVDMDWACNGTKQFKVLNQMVLHRSTCFDDSLPEDRLTIVKAGQILTGHAVAGADDYNYLMTTVKNPQGGSVICFLPAQAKADSSIKFAVQLVDNNPPPQRAPQRAPQQATQRRAPPPPPKKSPWSAVVADDGDTYYWNEETNETTWDRPPGFTG